MEDIEKAVVGWHESVFPNAKYNAINNKFGEEIDEFLDEYGYFRKKKVNFDRLENEFADMCIVFMALQNKLGRRTLTQCIADKLAVNKARKWGPEEADGNRKKVE